ncbi:MAG: hypothetical protein JXA60_07625 [Candidatus Coatesbacteria bacterium]|nr:hypothetical protein [Candidatus Coatesbacteria bacterium]
MSDMADTSMSILISLLQMGLGLVFYCYYSYCLMVIANKLGIENSWLAWIPIANIYIMVQCAEKPIWWIVLFFIPCVNIAAGVMVWMVIAERLGKPSWWGIMMVVPGVNVIVPGYLAFSE